MDIALLLKEKIDRLPPGFGQFLSYIPFKYRPGLGNIYKKRLQEIKQLQTANGLEKKKFIFQKVKNIVQHAISEVPFYKDYYAKMKFDFTHLNNFDDIKKIPVIDKKILQTYSLEDRSSDQKNRYIANTGGSSGKPLSFYIQPDSMGHEWAHMHTIWNNLDYNPSLLKLTFVGRGADKKKPVKYDAVRHQYSISIYEDFEVVAKLLHHILDKRKAYYLHGYPSAIYDFALYCNQYDHALREKLKGNLKGIFLGSEFPNQIWRSKMEDIFGVPSISWYGHTERAVLAYEKLKQYEYHPFHSYGYTEAESINGENYLLGTSYYNFASPLIRYNTEDIIKPIEFKEDLLERFQISKGRSGEFILDQFGKKIPLTGLIFGRHHKLFNFCSHVQVSQKDKGAATILYTLLDKNNLLSNFDSLFDSSNVNIKFHFEMIDSPIKTMSGKVNLLVNTEL